MTKAASEFLADVCRSSFLDRAADIIDDNTVVIVEEFVGGHKNYYKAIIEKIADPNV